ncbi:MAG: hypothetical protein ABSG59_22895 [Verrucomicrobiota bacterium]|jgi:hypothetical protein
MPNPLGKGTVNVSVNLLKQERLILGRLALADDRSLGEYVRRLILTGLRFSNPSAAAEMERARAVHAEQILLNVR